MQLESTSIPRTPIDTDLRLLAAWRTGDIQAGTSLFERHYPGVQRFFSNKVGNDDSEDLIQATFLGCLESLQRFRGEASFRTLLFAIARFKLLKYLRERCRDKKYLDPATVSIAASSACFTSILAANKQRRALLAALRRLPLDTQLMLELFYWEALPVKDIAVILELPANTVKTRMRRGREQLVKELAALEICPNDIESSLAGLDRWADALRRRGG